MKEKPNFTSFVFGSDVVVVVLTAQCQFLVRILVLLLPRIDNIFTCLAVIAAWG